MAQGSLRQHPLAGGENGGHFTEQQVQGAARHRQQHRPAQDGTEHQPGAQQHHADAGLVLDQGLDPAVTTGNTSSGNTGRQILTDLKFETIAAPEQPPPGGD